MGSLHHRLAGRLRPLAVAAVRPLFFRSRIARTPAAFTAATAARARVERLEPRALLAVSLDADGWTVVTPERGQRTVYVSASTGDDGNDGLTSRRPVRSLARGASLLRDEHGDRLLLRAGDVWYGSLPKWNKSGKSAREPMVVSSYGPGERPIIKSGDKSGFTSGRRRIQHVKLIGLHFHAHTRDPESSEFTGTAGSDGLYLLAPTTNLHVEDCVIDAYEKNVVIQAYYGRVTDLTFRRNVITDATGSGLYASGVNGLVVEDNVFDHNGWSERLPQYNRISRLPGHNIYLQTSVSRLVIRGNLIADAGSHGVQARSGGTITGNLFVRNPIHMSFGFVNGSDLKAGGVEGEISGNVFLGGRDIVGRRRGWALEIANTRAGGAGTRVKGNVFAHDTQRGYPAIRLGNGQNVGNATRGAGINDLTIEENVFYKWERAIGTSAALVAGASDHRGLNRLLVRNNDFQSILDSRIIDHGAKVDSRAETWAGNAYHRPGGGAEFKSGNVEVGWGTWHQYIDKTGQQRRVRYFAPERTLETYNAVLGGAARAKAFLAEARLQSRRVWRDRYATDTVLEYVRQGFDLVQGLPRVVAANVESPKNMQKARRKIVIYFNQDVSATLNKADLVVASRDTGRIIHLRDMRMTYDRVNHVATWTFPGVKREILPAGRWRVRLLGSGISASGKPFDGNGDGVGGDDWTRVFTVVPAV